MTHLSELKMAQSRTGLRGLDYVEQVDTHLFWKQKSQLWDEVKGH